MATALDAASKSWWSKAKSQAGSAPGYIPERPKLKGSKALGSLFGLKSKKQIPSFHFPDPHLPLQSIPRDPQSFAPRPPSNSVSSTRSRTDTLEPGTPSDSQHHKSRQSLLTLSDADPFASGRSIGAVASPSLPSDRTRLSAYSNSSSPDQPHRKDADGRPVQRSSSYASSSYSQSHANAPESPLPLSPILTSTGSSGFQGKPTNNGGQPPSLHGSGTSPSLGSKIPSRPPMRPRGLTDDCSIQKSGVSVDFLDHSANSAQPVDSRQPLSHRPSNASSSRSPPVTSPRVIVRQASLQHISSPTPPPTHRLPAPPQPPDGAADFPSQGRRLHSNSTASSTVSYASTSFSMDMLASPTQISSPVQTQQTSECSTKSRDRERKVERSKPSHAPLSPPVTLKKALSHQSLLKRGPFSSPTSSNGGPTAVGHDVEKASQKQRIFPNLRAPVSPLPLKHSNSSASTLNDQDQKRVSTNSGRKRLFSGSSLRRPSTSQSVAGGDEDTQSVFSMKSDQDLYINTSFFKPWISTQPSHPSFWDEATLDTVPGSPAMRGGADATTMPMSPTLGRMEFTRDAPPIALASQTLTTGPRQRGFSIRSSSTVASTEYDTESVLSGLSPRSQKSDQYHFHRSNITTSPRGTSSNQIKFYNKFDNISTGRPRTTTASSTGSKSMPDRSSAGQAILSGETKYTDVAFEQSFFRSTSSPPPSITSLPPPPRPRVRPTIITKLVAQPPKPVYSPSPLPSKLASPLSPSPPKAAFALSPRPTRRPHQKMSFEKALHRRSLMKKSSFLEIDDDDDDDDDDSSMDDKDDVVQLFEDPVDREPVSESFLDFARESFDTVRRH